MATGERRNLTTEEDRAFWAWAAIEVLRATGVRAEELVQLSHHSLVQYRRPSTGELIPLLQIARSKTDAERLLAVSPELADVLSTIISRIRGNGPAVPLVAACDDHERVWLPPAPVLFQRIGAENRATPAATIRKLLAAALARVRCGNRKRHEAAPEAQRSRRSRGDHVPLLAFARRSLADVPDRQPLDERASHI